MVFTGLLRTEITPTENESFNKNHKTIMQKSQYFQPYSSP